MGRLFGTDGVRGIANRELDSELAMKLGAATAQVLCEKGGKKARILIGKDSRISGDMLECALAAGLCSGGSDVLLCGMIPTPAIAYLVRAEKADAGIVISASHNKAEFNGIKVFDGNGYKLPDELEDRIEHLMLETPLLIEKADSRELGRVYKLADAAQKYADFICSNIEGELKGIRVGIDCANGAASDTAKLIFERLGAECTFISREPDGCNINEECGSTHLDAISKLVTDNGLDVGIAFDGDADRCLAVDEKGVQVDGDKIMGVFAEYLKKQGRLKDNVVVATVMSNLGFMEYMKNHGITVKMTAVGDRYVLEEMRRCGYSVGGEQSGHIILLERNTTGDGEMTAAMLLEIMREENKKLSELISGIERYPQSIVNVTASAAQKARFKEDDEAAGFIEAQQQTLFGMGRVLVRASGTEPLIRVMVEGKDMDTITACADDIAAYLKERLAE